MARTRASDWAGWLAMLSMVVATAADDRIYTVATVDVTGGP
jgi:hypothetical protein